MSTHDLRNHTHCPGAATHPCPDVVPIDAADGNKVEIAETHRFAYILPGMGPVYRPRTDIVNTCCPGGDGDIHEHCSRAPIDVTGYTAIGLVVNRPAGWKTQKKP